MFAFGSSLLLFRALLHMNQLPCSNTRDDARGPTASRVQLEESFETYCLHLSSADDLV